MNIYMIGIGGIGMSALAQLYLTRGDKVSGSDRVQSPTTEMLEKLGVAISYGQLVAKMPDHTDLVIYSDAIAENHVERAQAREQRKQQLSYFQALGHVSATYQTIAVTGTNGKTTTTAMLTKILKDTGKNPTAVIGSIVKDFGSNFVSGGELFVVEACEYRDHVLEINPFGLVLTNVEWDHTDWFKTEADMIATFNKAACKVPKEGFIVTNPAGKNVAKVLEGVVATVIDYTAASVPELKLVGEFNKMNARAAKAAARALYPDIDADPALASFNGTWRRFEYKGKSGAADVYDDYAHHPTAIAPTLKAVREKFPGRKIVVAFHPHLYSRTRDLMEDFARAFKDADDVLLAPIYPAREEPIEGVTSEVLAAKISATGTPAVAVASLDDVEKVLRTKITAYQNPIVVTMGAGDIYKVADKLV